MTQPIASAVRVAATPEQAKIFVALLQAEGIPAHVDGSSLADEFAMSRRLMNLGGTRVMVPTSSLERAREILGAVQIDEAELQAQALAAEAPEREEPQRPRPPRKNHWPLALTTMAAVTFLGLWLYGVDVRASAHHPFLRYEPTATGMREIRIADGKVLAEYFDDDHDGAYERIVVLGDDGQQAISLDEDRNGRMESYEEMRKQGVACSWTDTDGDGLMVLCVVKDAIGKELQRLQWVDGTGFQVQAR